MRTLVKAFLPALVLAATILAAPSAAGAAFVTAETYPPHAGPGEGEVYFHYEAVDGEQNRLTMALIDGRPGTKAWHPKARFLDKGAAVLPRPLPDFWHNVYIRGAECTNESYNRATCPYSDKDYWNVLIEVGAGRDLVRLRGDDFTAPDTRVDCGPGNDTLIIESPLADADAVSCESILRG